MDYTHWRLTLSYQYSTDVQLRKEIKAFPLGVSSPKRELLHVTCVFCPICMLHESKNCLPEVCLGNLSLCLCLLSVCVSVYLLFTKSFTLSFLNSIERIERQKKRDTLQKSLRVVYKGLSYWFQLNPSDPDNIVYLPISINVGCFQFLFLCFMQMAAMHCSARGTWKST